MYQWCEFKSCRGKNKNLTAQKNLILTLFGLIFRRIYNIEYLPSIISNFEIHWNRYIVWLSPA